MQKSKLIQVLKTFSKEEWKRLEKFITSEFFNNGRNYMPLLRWLKQFYPGFNSESMTRENLYYTLYPGKKYKEAVIFAVTSGLYSIVEEFLINTELNQYRSLKDLFINQQLQKRGLTNIFKSSFENFYNKLESGPFDSDNLEVLIKSDLLVLQHSGLLGRYENLNELFEKQTLNLVTSFLEKFSKVYHDLHANQTSFNLKIEDMTAYRIMKLIDFEKIINLIRDMRTGNICNIYLKIINYCYEQNEDDYFELKKLISSSIENLSRNELYELYTILADFCQDLIPINPEYIKELLLLYKEMLKNDIYLDSRYEYMHMSSFRNILAVALRNSEYNWAEGFVAKYFNELNPNIRENAYNFSNAWIQYVRSNYNKALEFANKVAFDDYFYKRDMKQLTLQIYYELNYFEEFLSFCDTFKHFLNSNKHVTLLVRKDYQELVKYSIELMNIKNNRKSMPIEKIKKEILANKYVTSRGWLMKKIDELTGN